MSFDHGSVTFTMFELNGDLPDDFVDLFAARKAGTLDSVGEEIQFGWVAGDRLLETAIDGASAQLGGCYFLTLRQAVRKMPTSLLNAICQREEKAYIKANNLEYVTRKVKKEIKEDALEKHLPKMPPMIGGITFVLDPNSKLMYVGATSNTQIDTFVENFFQTVKIEPLQINPGYLLEKLFKVTGASFPELAINGDKASEPAVGRDFLMWLWYFNEVAGKVRHEQYGEFEVFVEAPLVFVDDEDALGAAEVTIKKGGSPTRSAEAKAAIGVGKKLKKAKLTITREKQVWTCTFDADRFAFGSLNLPEGEVMSPDEVFAERIENLEVFKIAVETLFQKFGETMLGLDFPKNLEDIRAWAKNRDAV